MDRVLKRAGQLQTVYPDGTNIPSGGFVLSEDDAAVLEQAAVIVGIMVPHLVTDSNPIGAGMTRSAVGVLTGVLASYRDLKAGTTSITYPKEFLS